MAAHFEALYRERPPASSHEVQSRPLEGDLTQRLFADLPPSVGSLSKEGLHPSSSLRYGGIIPNCSNKVKQKMEVASKGNIHYNEF